ncbi:MAG: 50S ribosome-binding GTPase [Gammaproteobacteria bacterium]|nr:50S ribosome-binding GTPase [Gammaproteobacteria bacterium]
MLYQILSDLHEAVRTLDNRDSLSILNIDEDLLDSPQTTLEYLDRCRAWIRLRNIAQSIPDLLNQSDSIALVGFLGHFSAGKSSLINALLEVADNENPGYKREVGLHPTDTGITLITHRDHAHLIRKSAYTAIDAVDVVHGPALDFLEHATLVDTPGLGNEAAEQEAVTRFLHLCHVLVITIDGRRPFADKDKDFELLHTAFNKLAGVPKILVVTSAEEFLTSRMASFKTDWQEDQAEAFWTEAIQRLQRDSRFQDQLHRFQSAPRFFVDSKEGFRVQDVRDELLPIVTDDAHRSRIRQAQARYVLATSADALQILLAYISERSANLNRLQTGAQSRADGTATAVEELLQSLEFSFGLIKQRLQQSRQELPTGTFALENIVTPQAINENHGSTIRKLDTEIRQALLERLSEARNTAKRRLRRYFKRRTRMWFRTKTELNQQTLIQRQFSAVTDVPRISSASMTCGRAMLRLVNQHLATAFATAAQHLRGTSEAWEIGSRTQDIESSLERFQRTHDDSIRSFYSYISAPASSDLLREHGFVGFDESGEQAVQPESIDALNSIGFTAISQSAESCKERLRSFRAEDMEGYEHSADETDSWTIEDDALDEHYCAHVAKHIDAVCQRAFAQLFTGLSERLSRLADSLDEERSRFGDARRRIWGARATVLGRFALVAVFFAVAVIAFAASAPDSYEQLVSILPDDLVQNVSLSVASSLIGLAIVYIVSGARNENLRNALRPVVLERWATYSKWRTLANGLSAYFDESYDQLLLDVEDMPLEIDAAIVGGVHARIKNDSESYRQAMQSLEELREGIVARTTRFDEYIGVVNQRLGEIPQELRERADAIKKNAIEEHMSRIRSAAGSVEDVKSHVQRVADITKVV